MGCDIHSYAEKRNESGQWEVIDGVHPFDSRSYGAFAFLAGVRNYSAITPISQPRGIPEDASEYVKEEHESWTCDAHSASWLSVAELASFDYNAECEDRRCRVQLAPNCWSGAGTCEPGHGERQTFRKFLGEWFMQDIAELQEVGAERIVFWFDN